MVSAAQPTAPPECDSRCARILAYGDDLTAGYYNHEGAAFSPYADALRSALCASAAAASSNANADVVSACAHDCSTVAVDV